MVDKKAQTSKEVGQSRSYEDRELLAKYLRETMEKEELIRWIAHEILEDDQVEAHLDAFLTLEEDFAEDTATVEPTEGIKVSKKQAGYREVNIPADWDQQWLEPTLNAMNDAYDSLLFMFHELQFSVSAAEAAGDEGDRQSANAAGELSSLIHDTENFLHTLTSTFDFLDVSPEHTGVEASKKTAQTSEDPYIFGEAWGLSVEFDNYGQIHYYVEENHPHFKEIMEHANLLGYDVQSAEMGVEDQYVIYTGVFEKDRAIISDEEFEREYGDSTHDKLFPKANKKTAQMKAEPGSISHGTLREEDLIEAFMDTLSQLDRAAYDEALEELESFDTMEGQSKEEFDGWFLNEYLFDKLDEYAPEGHYFGAHPGDGSDIGFWPNEEEFEEGL